MSHVILVGNGDLRSSTEKQLKISGTTLSKRSPKPRYESPAEHKRLVFGSVGGGRGRHKASHDSTGVDAIAHGELSGVVEELIGEGVVPHGHVGRVVRHEHGFGPRTQPLVELEEAQLGLHEQRQCVYRVVRGMRRWRTVWWWRVRLLLWRRWLWWCLEVVWLLLLLWWYAACEWWRRRWWS